MDRKIAAALVSALALGVVSCGSAGPKLTREQLISKVEAACQEGGQTTQREMRGSSSTPVQYGSAITAGQRVIVARLRGLNPPAAAKRDFIAFQAGMQQRLQVYEQVLAALRGGGQPSAALQQHNLTLFRQLDALAKREGFVGCI